MNATQSHARLLREIADTIRRQYPNAASDVGFAADELERLDTLINSPHTAEFFEAVKLEAIHQRERWGTEHDAGKADEDWFWLLGYLAGKGVAAGKLAESAAAWSSVDEHAANVTPHLEKRLHHIVTTAAACLNWHAMRSGVDTRMRPGIAPPAGDVVDVEVDDPDRPPARTITAHAS